MEIENNIIIGRILNEFENQLKQFNDLLEEENGKNSEYGKLPYGINGSGIDEEDTGMEAYCNLTNQDLSNDSHEFMQVLDHWTNQRQIYPIEWVRILMLKAFEEGQKSVK